MTICLMLARRCCYYDMAGIYNFEMSLHTLAYLMFSLTKCMEGICQNVGLKKVLARIRIWHIGIQYFVPIQTHIQTINIAFLL